MRSLKLFVGFLFVIAVQADVSAQSWERLGPEGGLVVSLAASADGAIYLGTADGHIFVRPAADQPWVLRGRVGGRTDAVVTRLLVDPANRDGLCASVWYQQVNAGGGIFCSADGAKSWQLVGLNGEAVRALERAPSDASILVAGTITGVFRSADSGKTWQRISPPGDDELRNLDSVAVDPHDPNTIYAGTYHLPWKTTDGGKTWKPVVAGLIDDSDIMSLRIDVTDPSRVYLSACSGIYRSENQGEAWTKLQGIPYAARRTQAIVQDTQDPKTLHAATTEGLWVTRDAGETWQRTTPGEWVVNSVVVVPEQVVIGTEQGVFVSADRGASFAADNRGFTHATIKLFAQSAQDPKHLAMIAANGTANALESIDSGKSWSPLSLGVASAEAANALHTDEISQLYGPSWGWVVRLFDGRIFFREANKPSWTEWKLSLPAVRPSANPPPQKRLPSISALKTVGGAIEFSSNAIWLSTKQGLASCELHSSCQLLKGFGKEQPVDALGVSSDGRTIYFAGGNKFAVSTDSGKTALWHDLPASVEHAKTIVAIDGPEPLLLLATDRGLFASTDSGNTWQRRESGLPPGRVEQLLHADDLVVVTLADGGVYISHDRSATWQRVDRDAGRSRFVGLAEVAPGRILAASQSEGVLELIVAK